MGLEGVNKFSNQLTSTQNGANNKIVCDHCLVLCKSQLIENIF